MAIPLWIPIALAAASTAANYKAQRVKDKAAATSIRRNMERNAKEEEAAARAAARTEREFENQPEKMEAAGDELGEAFKAQQENIEASMAPSAVRPGESTDAVVDAERTRRQGTRRYTNQLADALGQLKGFDQSMLGANLASRDNLSDIRRHAGNMRGNNRSLERNLQADAQKGQGYGTLGDVLSMAAMVTSMGSLAAPASGGTNVAAQSSVVGPDFMSMSPEFMKPGWVDKAMTGRSIPRVV